jgi:mannose-1-phosphate guanylyltransferase
MLIIEALAKGDSESAAQLYYAMPSISIDYALMEKSKHVIAIKAGFSWDDIGSWDALERIQAPDADGNILVGDPVVLDSCDTVVYNVSGAESMAVGVIGADNLVVVVTTDGVLVCRKDRAQDVRKIVAALKDRGSPQV